MQRRNFIKSIIAVATGTILSNSYAKKGAAAWPAEHFAGGDFSTHFHRVFGHQTIADSDDIQISLPRFAEDGAVVPITISSELDGIKHIYIWVEKNPTPLAAEFELDEAVLPFVTARIKMAESCNVIVIARQGENLLRRQQWVEVMLGGCGTG